MVLAMEVEESPTLSSGAFTVTFGDYEKVKNAVAMIQEPAGTTSNDDLFCFKTSISGNTVTVTVLKIDITGSSNWANATTSDLDDKTVVVIADCE